MNNYYLLIPLAILLFITSCSKSNSTKPTPAQITLVGKWDITGDTTREGVTGQYVETFILNKKYNPYYQFNSDYSGSRMIDTTGANDKWTYTWNYTDTSNVITFRYPIQLVDGQDFEANFVVGQVQLLTATRLKIFLSYPADAAQGAYNNEYIYLTREN